MTRYVIVPIVEGHGEVQAVPILIQRWLQHRRFHLNFSQEAPFMKSTSTLAPRTLAAILRSKTSPPCADKASIGV